VASAAGTFSAKENCQASLIIIKYLSNRGIIFNVNFEPTAML
jgi:hypothetical protein